MFVQSFPLSYNSCVFIRMSSNPISIGSVAEALEAECNSYTDGNVTGVTHDSRQVRNGTLFVAIKGHTMDGHRFIDDVMRRGAAGVISEYEPPESFDGAWLKV